MSDYGFEHDGKVFTPNGTPGISPEENTDRNRAIEVAELEHWKTHPDRGIAYFKLWGGMDGTPGGFGTHPGDVVTTWLGTDIGSITSVSVYRHNFGGRFISLRCRIHGVEYYGRASYDNGSIIRLRRAK